MQATGRISQRDRVRPRPALNGNDEYCPRCGGFLIKDLVDLSCFWCGWRECCYFQSGDTINPDLIQELLWNRYVGKMAVYIEE
jgi:hypothetical protein